MLLSNHISNPFYVDGIPYVTNPYGTIELGFGVERRTDGVWFNVFPTKISVYRQNIS